MLFFLQLKDIPAEVTLNLKKGAQVILLANIDVKGGLVNGSRGVIIDWIDAAEADRAANAIQSDPKSKKKGGQFGGEEWKAQASSEWLEAQSEDKFPIVLFAAGITSRSCRAKVFAVKLIPLRLKPLFDLIRGVGISTK